MELLRRHCANVQEATGKWLNKSAEMHADRCAHTNKYLAAVASRTGKNAERSGRKPLNLWLRSLSLYLALSLFLGIEHVSGARGICF